MDQAAQSEDSRSPSRPLLSLTCVQALCDGGGVNKETAAEAAADVRVELIEREPGLWKMKNQI